MAKMNPEVKARWVAALRSGEYKQTKGVLKKNGGHCCLGVLCDLYAREAGLPNWGVASLSDAAEGKAFFAQQGDAGLPGARVVIWSGLNPDANVRIKSTRQPLYDHNDNGATFAEIADAIEKQL